MHPKFLFALLTLAAAAALADGDSLNKYVIERVIPGASEMSAEELDTISQQSREVLERLGPDIQWLRSYVAEDRFYCVYKAPNKALIKKHASLGGFPANRISLVSTVIDGDPGGGDPVTAE